MHGVILRDMAELQSSSGAIRRGEYAPSIRRRQVIVEAVLQVVNEAGYESVTVNKISQMTGIPEASILYHFPTCDHLLVGALRYSDDLMGDMSGINQQNIPFDMDTFALRLDTMLAQRNLRMLAIHMRGKSMLEDHPAHDYFLSYDRRVIDVWTRVVTGLQSDGKAHPSLDPRESAIRIIALWEGLSLLNAVDPTVDIKERLLFGMRQVCGINWQDFVHEIEKGHLGM